ncbi:MAG TPA: hypothetical protein ENI80_10420 [Acidiferrobacteraceae bacterium]|nr:hypothetical protein [Acidiferrobacteraceae bacterium]
MRKIIKHQGMGILAGLLMIPIAAWAGQIRIENETGSTIRVSCGDHGSAGHTGNIHHGHHRTLHVSHHGEIECHALSHGDTVASRSFHFDPHNTHFKWHVVVHHGSESVEEEVAGEVAGEVVEGVLKGIFGSH